VQEIGQRVLFLGNQGHFYKTAKRRGTGCPRPLDLGSTTEIRFEREGYKLLILHVHGSHSVCLPKSSVT
jgi:hypothetical protein